MDLQFSWIQTIIPKCCLTSLFTDCWTLWSRRRSVSTPWSTWCWTRPTGCWTWASCPTSSASSTIPTCPPRWVHVYTDARINNVVQQLQGSRQTLMFSATFPETIRKVASEFLHAYLFLYGEAILQYWGNIQKLGTIMTFKALKNFNFWRNQFITFLFQWVLSEELAKMSNRNSFRF